MSSYQDYRPHEHSAVSSMAVEAGEGVKSGLKGALKGAATGILLGTALWGGAAAWVAASAFGLSAGAVLAVGLTTAVLTATSGLSLFLGGALMAIGASLGIFSGVERGSQRVAGERAASHMVQAHDAEMGAYREMAKARGLEAQANIATAQAYIVAQQTGGGMASEPIQPKPAITQASMEPAAMPANPMLQAGSNVIDAATIAQMGRADMNVQQMAKS